MAKGNDDIIEVNGLLSNLNATLKAHADLLDKAADGLVKYNQNVKMPSEYLKQQEKAKQNTDAIVAGQDELVKANAAAIKSLMDEIEALKKKQNELGKTNKLTGEAAINARILRTESARVATTTASEANEYERLNAQMNLNIRAAQGMAVQMYNLERAGQKNGVEYKALATTLDSVQKEVTQADAALKAVDASLGRNQRNVGNYKSTWNGLGNAVNQVTRELPAFTFSAQTGFLAISNNLPTLFDEIQKINGELKGIREASAAATVELQAQTEMQLAAAAASETQAEALAMQTETIIANTGATAEQAAEIRALMRAQITEIRSTGAASAATLENTEVILANIGATAEQIDAVRLQTASTEQAALASLNATTALEAQTIATAEAVAASAAAPGVLSRITSSLFSLNGLLVAGTLVLTLYGKEIVNWVEELFGAGEAVKFLADNQKKLDEARVDGIKSVVKAEIELKELLNIVKDPNLSNDEREIALKKLRALYPFYFKDLKDNAILAGETAKAEDAIRIALERRGQADKASAVITTNKQKLLDLQQELDLQNELIASRKAQSAEINSIEGVNPNTRLNATTAVIEAEKGRVKIQNEMKAVLAQNAKEEAGILLLRKQSIGLDYQEDKSKKDKLQLQRELTEAQKDYSATEFEIVKLQLENQIKYNTDIVNNNERSIDQRKTAAMALTKYLIELAELEYKEELRVNNFKLADDLRVIEAEKANALAKNKEDLANKTGAVDKSFEIVKNASDKEAGITKETQDKNLLAYVKVADKRKTIFDDTIKYLKGVEDKYNDTIEKNGINEAQLEGIRQMNLMLANISSASSAEDFKKIEDLKVAIATNTSQELIDVDRRRASANLQIYEDAYQERVKLEERLGNLLNTSGPLSDTDSAEIEAIKLKLSENLKSYDKEGQAYKDLMALKISLDKAYEDAETQKHQERINRIKELKAETDNYIKSFSEGFLTNSGLSALNIFFDKTFDSITGKYQTTFEKMWEGAETTQEKFQVAFLAISQAATQVFAFLTQSSETAFANELSRLDKQKETQIKFAGDSATAKAEIERQYDEKRADIERRKAKAAKEAAIFNAVIGVAQAIVSALPNLFLAAVVGAIGAVQIAAIQAQPLPKFMKGGRHTGGWMMVNDGPGNRTNETIVTDSGKVIQPQGKNVIMRTDEGATVYTQDQWENHVSGLNGLLGNNDISPVSGFMMDGTGTPTQPIIVAGATAAEIDAIMGKYIGDLTPNHFDFDEKGFTKAILNKGQKTIYDANRGSSIPQRV